MLFAVQDCLGAGWSALPSFGESQLRVPVCCATWRSAEPICLMAVLLSSCSARGMLRSLRPGRTVACGAAWFRQEAEGRPSEGAAARGAQAWPWPLQAWPWPVQHWPCCGLQERAKILAEKESAHREKEALIEKIELQLARREKRLAKEKVRPRVSTDSGDRRAYVRAGRVSNDVCQMVCFCAPGVACCAVLLPASCASCAAVE